MKYSTEDRRQRFIKSEEVERRKKERESLLVFNHKTWDYSKRKLCKRNGKSLVL